jgi:uncharacterized NAD(P)/FAD-binding protein YdhS
MRKAPFTVCVVGGGFTRAAVAIALMARIRSPFRLVIVERGRTLGRGIAYGSYHPLHLLNVRTRDLSVCASQPGDFLNWAFGQLDQGENQAGLHEALAHTFLPRQLFGEYVRERLNDSVRRRPDVTFSVINDTAISCIADGGCYRIAFEQTAPVPADSVFLATAYGILSASTKEALKPFEDLPAERLAAARTIALIGSGLTMVDVLLSARRDGFHGEALVISRRAQLPRPHAPQGVVPKRIDLPRSKTCLPTGNGGPHCLRDGRRERHAMASDHQRSAPFFAADLAGPSHRRAGTFSASPPLRLECSSPSSAHRGA